MLTVKFTEYSSGCVSVDGYPLHEIDVVYGLSASGACGNDQNQIQVVGTVWVDNRAATIDDAFVAGYTLYDPADCTRCAGAGYYGHHDPTIPGVDPSTIYMWNFKNTCRWEGSLPCSGRQITVVYDRKQDNVCNDIGNTAVVWIDEWNFNDATGVFETSTFQELNYLVEANICTEQFDNQCSNLYWFKEKDVDTHIKRLNGATNEFIQMQICSVDPDPSTRYEHQLYYADRERYICDYPAIDNVIVWTDAERFIDSTTMWAASSGTGRPLDGYYKSMIAQIGGNEPYYLFEAPSYTLDISNPTGTCDTGDDFNDDPR